MKYYVDPMFVLGALIALVFGILAGSAIEGIVFAMIFVLIGAIFETEEREYYETQSDETEIKTK